MQNLSHSRRVAPNDGNPAQVARQVLAPHSLDRDVEAMLRKSQPGYFSGEGDDVGKQLEEWLEKMDDPLAHSSQENNTMMGRFKLEKLAKNSGGKIIVEKIVST